MQKTIPAGLALAICFSLHCFAQGPAAIACLQDLEVIPTFLLENDTGARDHLTQFGQKYFDNALAEAKSAASQIRGNASCAPVITKYLRAYRHGHLSVEDITPVAATSPAPLAETVSAPSPEAAPAIELLSAKTLRLALKSFAPRAGAALITLINAHRRDLEKHPNWIIDVRGNGGGADSSFGALMSWLMSDELATASAEILATPANIDGWTRLCPPPGADVGCSESVTDSIERMRKAAPGT